MERIRGQIDLTAVVGQEVAVGITIVTRGDEALAGAAADAGVGERGAWLAATAAVRRDRRSVDLAAVGELAVAVRERRAAGRAALALPAARGAIRHRRTYDVTPAAAVDAVERGLAAIGVGAHSRAIAVAWVAVVGADGALTAGRPGPEHPGVARIYDLVMTHLLDADDFFIHRVQQHCAERGLNFFLIEPLWAEAFLQNLQAGKVWPRVLLNMHSEHHQPEDIFHRLINLAAAKNTRVIDPPDRAQAAFDKSRLHPHLVGAGIPVPWTLVVPRESPEGWKLSAEEQSELGQPFVIKPAMGYGRKGLVLDATSEADLERSIAAWPDNNHLFQRRIVPRERDGAPVYFRVYYVFGSVWLSWWNCYTDHYRMVTDAERSELQLDRLEEIIRQIATLTGMTFFSSEIAQAEDGEFVVIDYVNDQCHLLSQSAHPQLGVPDELISAIAKKIVEAVQTAIRQPATTSP